MAAGLMIWRGNRISERPSPIGYVIPGVCVVAGAASIYILAKWTLLGLAAK